MAEDRTARPDEGARAPVPPAVSGAPEPPQEAVDLFGDQLPLARRYADLLATTGISHGLVGPREAPRLWERHLVNCALLESMLEQDSTVVDIGSGAGLPGIVLAIIRPDLQVHLVEPLLRRTTWLEAAVEELGLTNVSVHRGRADEMTLTAPVVTARAVASLERLVSWSFPLMPAGGRLLALKGEAAAAELEEAEGLLTQIGVQHSSLHVLGEEMASEPIRVVEIVRPETVHPVRAGSSKKHPAKQRRKAGSGGRRGSGQGQDRARERGQERRRREGGRATD